MKKFVRCVMGIDGFVNSILIGHGSKIRKDVCVALARTAFAIHMAIYLNGSQRLPALMMGSQRSGCNKQRSTSENPSQDAGGVV